MSNLKYDRSKVYLTIDGVRMPPSLQFVDIVREEIVDYSYPSYYGGAYYRYGPTKVTAIIDPIADLVLHTIDPVVRDRDWTTDGLPQRDWQ